MMLAHARRARLPGRARSCRSPPSARPASELDRRRQLEVQPLADETIQGFDLALFSAGGATSSASGRRSSSPPARSSSTTPRLAHGRRRPAGRRRGQPRGARRRTQGHRRQPELHDDGRDAAGQGAARRVGHDARWSPRATRPSAAPGRRAIDELAAQVPVLHETSTRSSTTARSAARASSRASTRTRSPSTSCRSSATLGERRLHRRGAQDDERDAARSSACRSSRSRRPACACR